MKHMKLPVSIIIPARNEEKYLPRLLQSIQEQTAQPNEIIVADGHSTDDTRNIAQSFGCKVTVGGTHPGIARNNGAKLATQPIFLFLDADVILPKDFLEKNTAEFIERKLGVASCFSIPYSKKMIDHIGAFLNNLYYSSTETFLKNAVGFCLFARKEIHEKIGGFDESIKIAEDQDYAVRASKISKYRFLHSRKIIISVRRFDQEGRLALTLKYLHIYFYTTFRGKIRKFIVPYSFSRKYKGHV